MTTVVNLASALVVSVDDLAKAIADVFDIQVVHDDIPVLSQTIRPIPYTPSSLDASDLPCLYLWRVGDAYPDTGNDGHSTHTGTFLRDFEFHLATATIGQQNEADREETSRLLLDGCIYQWLQNYDLGVDFVEDWWYTGDRGIAVLREFSQKFIGSILTFRVRSRWLRP